ncbi:hypothetical protein, partial [Flavonifractor plautii]|uniref:hypothetical protein n=1 Tax=Flavonifractor plautii TaxID=292800 RepID=UPI003D7D5C8F
LAVILDRLLANPSRNIEDLAERVNRPLASLGRNGITGFYEHALVQTYFQLGRYDGITLEHLKLLLYHEESLHPVRELLLR